MQIDLGFE